MSTDEAKNEEPLVDDDTWITVPKKKKREVGVGVVTEDHPVVKKILEFIEKVIKPIENVEVKLNAFDEYLSKLSIKELVIYGIYCGVGLFIPDIYKYDESVGLCTDYEIKLRHLLEYQCLDL
jgi:hypothetical protein